MVKRLFVSVGIPPETAKKLTFAAETIVSEIPDGVRCRITKPDNQHFTIIFLGSQEEGNIPLIKEAIREAIMSVGKHSPKTLLKEIDYAGEEMVWVYAESKWMTEFAVVLGSILRREKISFDKKPFKAHLTLIRMKTPYGVQMPNVRTEIGEDVGIDSVELMESTLTSDGPVYTTLFSEKTVK